MFIDKKARQLNIKLAYAGPRRCGASTCLEYLHTEIDPELRSKLVRIRHLGVEFFDFVPRSLQTIGGLRIRLHLYTLEGEAGGEHGHRDLVKGADGLMFVADSQRSRSDANTDIRAHVESLIAQGGAARPEIPWVFSYNKRDLPDALPVAELAARLDPAQRYPGVATIATRGEGVFAALTALIGPTIAAIRAELGRPAAPGPTV